MNLRRLVDFLHGGVSVGDFLREIDPEVNAYRSGLNKKGGSVPIHVTEDNFDYVIRREDIKKLCDLYLQGAINEWHIGYIGDAMELAPTMFVQDEEVEDALLLLANPTVNLPLNVNTIRRIYESL